MTEPATPEFSHPVAVDRLPPEVAITANPTQCAAIAARLHIPAVTSLRARFNLRRQGMVVAAQGRLEAKVVQTCVVTLEPVHQAVDDSFTIRFIPEGRDPSDDDPDSPDEIPYAGSIIDLGEAATEQLALALDPYPRAPDAELDPAFQIDPAAGHDTPPTTEPNRSLLAGLSALNRKQ